MAVGLAVEGKTDEAETHFAESVMLAPRRPEPHLMFAIFLADRGRWTQAIEQYRLTLRLDPKNQDAADGLLRAQELRRTSPEKIAQPHKVIPDQAALERLNNDAVSLAARGDWDQAIERYRRILAVDPDFFKAHNNLGVALAARGRADEAYAHFARAAALMPENADIRFYFGNFLAKQGRIREAAEQFRIGSRLSPERADLRANLSKAEEILKRSPAP